MRLIALLLFLTGSLAFYTGKDKIVELTDANFESKVLKSPGIWVVEFYAPYCGHCKNLVPEYKKAAKILEGIANVGAIDATVHQKNPGKYQIQGYPTIKIFGAGGKNKAIDYNGPRTAAGISDAVKKEIEKTLKNRLNGGDSKKSGGSGKKGGEVVVLTDANFEELVLNSKDSWLVEFFAPWCGHCQKLEPEWKKAAKKMAGKVKFGALDATANEVMARKFQIQGFPTIKYFAPGASANDAEDYQGGRTSADLVSFAESKFETVAPPSELVEATGQKAVEDTCKDKQLCIFTFLPSIYDCQSNCRVKHLKMLRELADLFKARRWGWLWMEAGAQENVEKAFELGDSGYPVLTALSPNKMKFTTLLGSFSLEGIKEFLNSVSYGKARVRTVASFHLSNGFLKASQVEPWDGKDKELPVIDDIDLSDVNLDDRSEL